MRDIKLLLVPDTHIQKYSMYTVDRAILLKKPPNLVVIPLIIAYLSNTKLSNKEWINLQNLNFLMNKF